MITVIGSINLDMVSDMDRLPAPGETVHGSTFRTAPGGKGANQALAAARAGASVRMLGAVGRDGFAVEALAMLKAAKVDLSGLGESHASTGVALIFVDAHGENVIVVVAGANGTVVPGDLVRVPLSPADVVLLQHEIPLPTVEAALDAVQAAGAVSILNTAPFHADAVSFLSKADYVVANETEFDLYSALLDLPGDSRQAQMQAFAAQAGSTVIVTLGGEGVVAATRQGDTIAVPALPITPVDTVGAGDTFCGYFAAGLSAGLPLRDALVRAAAAGSLACLKPGAQPSVPTASDVDESLALR